MSSEVYLCGGLRTPIGRYGASLSGIRADDLASLPIKGLIDKYSQVDWELLDDVIFGCANQAGEDNRNVARMGSLLAGISVGVPGSTINRLCGSGMDAVSIGARAIKTGELEFVIAGGVESMSRAPYVMPKAETAFSRSNAVYDTTIGWRFVNPKMFSLYGTDSMPETAENVAQQFNISREDQDKFALWSQEKTAIAQKNGRFADEIIPVEIPQRKGGPISFSDDEHPRETNLQKLSSLKGIVTPEGTVTAGNASGVNDGACALILANERIVKKFQLDPIARIVGFAVAGVEPRIMGVGPIPAVQKLLKRTRVNLDQVGVIELNEAFAAQALAVTRELGIEDNDSRINPNGGAIALGHPLGMSGARLVLTAARELQLKSLDYALTTMCIGVGQGIAGIFAKP